VLESCRSSSSRRLLCVTGRYVSSRAWHRDYYVYSKCAFGAPAGFASGSADWLNNCSVVAYGAAAAAEYFSVPDPDMAARQTSVALALLFIFLCPALRYTHSSAKTQTAGSPTSRDECASREGFYRLCNKEEKLNKVRPVLAVFEAKAPQKYASRRSFSRFCTKRKAKGHLPACFGGFCRTPASLR
jgi:hypothetical protein